MSPVMRALFLAAVASAAITACDPPHESIVATNAEIMEGARMALRETLKDPANAEFRNEKVVESGGKIAVCGEVNAPNSYGGKTGYQRFVSENAGSAVIEEGMDILEFEVVWAKSCF